MPRKASAKTALGPKKFLLAAFIAVALAGLAVYGYVQIRQSDRVAKPTLRVESSGRSITYEVAEDEEARSRGLSGRESLAEGTGMLFVFEENGQPCFWMKDMNFSIDMVWLNEARQVVHLESRVGPETFPDQFCPDEAARYVLEVNAGAAESLGLTEGAQASF